MTEASDGGHGVQTGHVAEKSGARPSIRGRPCTVLIEGRSLVRECVLASLRALEPGHDFLGFDGVDAWSRSADASRTSLVILCMLAPPTQPAADSVFRDWLRQVLERPNRPPVAVISDCESVDLAAVALTSGACAFLSAAMVPQVMVKVLAILRAGGTFVPINMLSAITPDGRGRARAPDLAELLSPREIAVASALSKGQPNKAIAHELGLTESSVRGHVRTVLRKLKAKNRTEAAFLLRDQAERPRPH